MPPASALYSSLASLASLAYSERGGGWCFWYILPNLFHVGCVLICPEWNVPGKLFHLRAFSGKCVAGIGGTSFSGCLAFSDLKKNLPYVSRILVRMEIILLLSA